MVFNKRSQRMENIRWHEFKLKQDGLLAMTRAGYDAMGIDNISHIIRNSEVSKGVHKMLYGVRKVIEERDNLVE